MATDNKRTMTPNDAARLTELPEGCQLLLVDKAGEVLERMEAARFMELVRASVRVGGRNLIPGSERISMAANDSLFHYIYIKKGLSVKAGESFVASCGDFSLTGPKAAAGFQMSIHSSDLSRLLAKFVLTGPERTAMASIKEDCTDAVVLLYTGTPANTAGMALDVAHLKLERGNVVSDWSPAPEDSEKIGGGG